MSDSTDDPERLAHLRESAPTYAARSGALAGTAPDAAVLDEIVRRIVRIARPEKIILFGSAARGDMGPHSDIDLLVVKRGKYRHIDLVGDIYANLRGVGAAVDIIVATPEELQRYGESFALVYYPALHEGRVLYAA
jgi:predicted nucleotidyltransferase